MNYRAVFPAVLSIVLMVSTSCFQESSFPIVDDNLVTKVIEFDPESIKEDFDSTSSFQIQKSTQIISEGLYELQLKFSSKQAAVLPKTVLRWDIPCVDIDAYWTSNITVDRVTLWSSVDSRASSQAPVICLKDASGQNRFSMAVSDALNYVKSGFYLKEEDARIYFYVVLFDEPQPKTEAFQLKIRFDVRTHPYADALKDISDWYAQIPDYEPAEVPDVARKPVYSTWYNFHQNLFEKEILKELRIGKEIGLETIIIDDGWQTMDNKRGYAWTGDWNPDRIPQMGAFVDSVHHIGMKCMLWYSLPFVGKKAQSYPEFKGKYLAYWESQGAYVLDPRYPEVREHIINTYEKAIKEWNLDGFKLDFMGWFKAQKDTELTIANGRDFASVNDATDRLMTDIMKRLKAIKPDVMIEFRQPYIGPVMRKYGNMFRAADCPNMAIVNRNRTLSLRLLSGNTAVHSDMFMWNRAEDAEDAALQILNVLFSVPQLSVKLDSIPQRQMEMTRFWMNYWNENRRILLGGKLNPMKPEALFPLVTASTDEKTIAAYYNDMVLPLEKQEYKQIDIVNAKAESNCVFRIDKFKGDVKLEVFDCCGNLVYSGLMELSPGLHSVEIPPSGLAQLKTYFNE